MLARDVGCIGNEVGCVSLALPVPPNFSLLKAVCSYGFFMMAPNSWVASSASDGFLERPLRLLDGRAVFTKVQQSGCNLDVSVLGVPALSDPDKENLLAQVSRMLRLSDVESSAITAFHSLHLKAKETGFGRLFRSPTLFEDMIKSLLLCNCGWGRTLSMAKALCELQAELKGLPLGHLGKTTDLRLWPDTPEPREIKRKQVSKKRRCSKVRRTLKLIKTGEETAGHQEFVSSQQDREEIVLTRAEADPCGSTAQLSTLRSPLCQDLGAFPTPEELCDLDATYLSKRCGLGYRAHSIVKLANDICKGIVDLQLLQNAEADPSLRPDAKENILQINGFGPFSTANVLMCMGDYCVIPTDTETVRHLKQVHGMSKCTIASVANDAASLYAPYAPYQFLSYWFEIWASYEQIFGKLSCIDPRCYNLFTGRNMTNKIFESKSLEG